MRIRLYAIMSPKIIAKNFPPAKKIPLFPCQMTRLVLNYMWYKFCAGIAISCVTTSKNICYIAITFHTIVEFGHLHRLFRLFFTD